MIAVDRNRVPVPTALAGANSRGAREVARNQTRLANGQKLTFAAYKDRSIKVALTALFHGKCAYCESPIEGTQPMDVEHFRPKGGYIENGALQQPGYWWLAADWDNLLPSCIDCNRRRQHWDDDDAEYGKESLFPVEGPRAQAPDNGRRLGAEKRLLIDPCRDDATGFFRYGDQGAIQRKPRIRGRKRRMADESMQIYGLVRPGLRSLRRDRQSRVLNQIRLVKELLRQLVADTGSAELRRRCATALYWLRELRQEGAAYAGMARQYIDSKLPAIRDFLERTYGAELRAGGNGDPDVLDRFIAAFADPDPLIEPLDDDDFAFLSP